MLDSFRAYIRHRAYPHYRSVMTARIVSCAAATCGVHTVVTNCEHNGCEGWIVLPRIADQAIEGWRARG